MSVEAPPAADVVIDGVTYRPDVVVAAAPADELEPPSPPKPTWGPSSYLGFILAVGGSVAGVVAAVQGNDPAMVTAGTAAVIAAVATISSRTAQAIVLARHFARMALPFVEAVAQDPAD